jgi:hypothetical protein
MGVAIVGLLVGAMASLDQSRAGSMEQSVADRIARDLSSISCEGDHRVFSIRVDDYLPVGDWSVELGNGTVTVVHASTKCLARVDPLLTLVDPIAARIGDILVVECVGGDDAVLVVHVAKAEEMPFTASANFLQSAIVL